ncbi:MAG: hypothetical protein ACOCRK_03985 [bacterium]
MWCPKCKSAYEDGVTYCMDCNEDLVKDLKGAENINTIDLRDVTWLTSKNSLLEANEIVEKLLKNGIDSFKREKENQYYKTYEIYVPNINYQEAKDLVEPVEIIKKATIDEDLKAYNIALRNKIIKYTIISVVLFAILTYLAFFILNG